MENKKTEKIIIAIVLVLQTIIFVIAGVNKAYIHMDEAYSFGLANYDKIEIQDNEDFFDTWHSKEYYEDYLCVNDDESGKFEPVYVNQENDVHPPLYYFLLRIAMEFHKNSYSKWSGIIINIIIYEFITVFMYLILQKLFKNQTRCKEKSIVLAFISAIVMSSITNAVYIRMYALSTLNVVITTYLHLKLLERDKVDLKLLCFIGLSALVGSLTHYYYLFYLAMMFIMFAIKYIKEKRFKELGAYVATMCIAGALSLVIFPYSIQHMFFGYRGKDAMKSAKDSSLFTEGLKAYVKKINRETFSFLMYGALGFILIGTICMLIKKKKFEKNIYLKYIAIPTIFYFLIISATSPWFTLRYIEPVCGLIFIMIMYLLESVWENVIGEKCTMVLMSLCLIAILVIPMILKIEPEEMYSNKSDIVSKVENELNVPTIYVFKSNQNRFLDDILLFAKLNESYIAKDLECTDENINEILEGKDLSRGLLIFVNEGQDNEKILDEIKNATGLSEWEKVKDLNSCKVYYIK